MPLAQLASDKACLLAIWMTNSRHIQARVRQEPPSLTPHCPLTLECAAQRFVESKLLPSCGARRIGCWYWLKVSVDGRFSTGGVLQHSPPTKPQCLLGISMLFMLPPPPPPLRKGSAIHQPLTLVTIMVLLLFDYFTTLRPTLVRLPFSMFGSRPVQARIRALHTASHGNRCSSLSLASNPPPCPTA